MAAALAAAPTAVDIARAVEKQARELFATSQCTVLIVNHASHTLESLLPVVPGSALDDVDLAADVAVAVAARTQTPVWSDVGGVALPLFAVPKGADDAAAIAVVGFAWSPPVPITEQLRSVALGIADIAGPALARAMSADSDHAALSALKGRLLGTPATVDGLDVAVQYLPGQRTVGLGGDWYDTVVRSDGTLVVILGDVAGHGVEAVAARAQLQYLINGLVRLVTPPHQVFTMVNEMIDSDVYATAQLFFFDPVRQRMGYANAGHPWALLRRPSGAVALLDATPSPPIGILDEAPQPLTCVDFEPGALLLAYTDGLVERRERSIVDRIDRLATALAKVDADRDVDDVLADLVTEARLPDEDGDPVDDDVAAVLVRG
jgi:serine phosphatase RsbU (regulator of sigma subunit)